MPGFDGSGPLGRGPMTGRGLGNCVAPAPQQSNETVNVQNVQQNPNVNAGAQQPPQQVQPVQQPAFYGVGRGGLPRGCGMGFLGGRGRGGMGRGRRF